MPQPLVNVQNGASLVACDIIVDGIRYTAAAWAEKCARERDAGRMERIEVLLTRLVELMEARA